MPVDAVGRISGNQNVAVGRVNRHPGGACLRGWEGEAGVPRPVRVPVDTGRSDQQNVAVAWVYRQPCDTARPCGGSSPCVPCGAVVPVDAAGIKSVYQNVARRQVNRQSCGECLPGREGEACVPCPVRVPVDEGGCISNQQYLARPLWCYQANLRLRDRERPRRRRGIGLAVHVDRGLRQVEVPRRGARVRLYC